LISGKSSKKKKRKKIISGEDELSGSLSKIQLSLEPKIQSSQSKPQHNSQCKDVACQSKSSTAQPKDTAAQSDPQQSANTTTLPTDPAKRIKNLRKRLREIESIEQKIAAGEQKLEKEQLDKVSRKKEILSEIEQLTYALGGV
jgi:partner of Y14 and mago protein